MSRVRLGRTAGDRVGQMQGVRRSSSKELNTGDPTRWTRPYVFPSAFNRRAGAVYLRVGPDRGEEVALMIEARERRVGEVVVVDVGSGRLSCTACGGPAERSHDGRWLAPGPSLIVAALLDQNVRSILLSWHRSPESCSDTYMADLIICFTSARKRGGALAFVKPPRALEERLGAALPCFADEALAIEHTRSASSWAARLTAGLATGRSPLGGGSRGTDVLVPFGRRKSDGKDVRRRS